MPTYRTPTPSGIREPGRDPRQIRPKPIPVDAAGLNGGTTGGVSSTGATFSPNNPNMPLIPPPFQGIGGGGGTPYTPPFTLVGGGQGQGGHPFIPPPLGTGQGGGSNDGGFNRPPPTPGPTHTGGEGQGGNGRPIPQPGPSPAGGGSPSGIHHVPPYKFTVPYELQDVFGGLPQNWQADIQGWEPNLGAAFLRAWQAQDWGSASEIRGAAYKAREQLESYRASLKRAEQGQGAGNGNGNGGGGGQRSLRDRSNNPYTQTNTGTVGGGTLDNAQGPLAPSLPSTSGGMSTQDLLSLNTQRQQGNGASGTGGANGSGNNDVTQIQAQIAKLRARLAAGGGNSANIQAKLKRLRAQLKALGLKGDGTNPNKPEGSPQNPFKNRATTNTPLAYGGSLRV